MFRYVVLVVAVFMLICTPFVKGMELTNPLEKWFGKSKEQEPEQEQESEYEPEPEPVSEYEPEREQESEYEPEPE